MSNTVMLIHGAWLTPAGWSLFQSRYESRGYKVHAPAWPMEDVPLEELRRAPNPELRKLTIGRIVRHYEDLIRALPEPPIIIGHSYGGLFTQMLLDRGLGAAGVALDPVPIRGVLPRPAVLLSAMPVFLAWNGWNRVLKMSFHNFATRFAQTLPENEKRAYYERYIAPTPGRLYYQAAFGIGAGIHASNPHRPPLLLCVGERDITITPGTVRAVYKVQQRSSSVTAFKSFPSRSHFLFAEPGWEEVADYAIDWASMHEVSAASMRRAS